MLLLLVDFNIQAVHGVFKCLILLKLLGNLTSLALVTLKQWCWLGPMCCWLGKALQSPLLSLWQHQRLNSLEEKLIRSYTERENLSLNSFIFKASLLQ